MTSKVTQARIAELLARVTIVTTVEEKPTKYVEAKAWLDGSFLLASQVSKAADPENFDEEMGLHYSKVRVMKDAENKLWELEGYRKFLETQGA